MLGQAADRVAAWVRYVRVGDLGAYLYGAHLLGKCNVVVHVLLTKLLVCGFPTASFYFYPNKS